MKLETAMNLLTAAIFVVVIVGALWLQLAAPCSWHAWSSAKDVPARCLGYFGRER